MSGAVGVVLYTEGCEAEMMMTVRGVTGWEMCHLLVACVVTVGLLLELV